MRFDLIVRGGTIVNHDGQGPGDVGVKDGKITVGLWRRRACMCCPA